jgi:hypothetical protein
MEFTRRSVSLKFRTLRHSSSGALMFKFLGSAVGIIFLIGLVVVILLLKFIF